MEALFGEEGGADLFRFFFFAPPPSLLGKGTTVVTLSGNDTTKKEKEEEDQLWRNNVERIDRKVCFGESLTFHVLPLSRSLLSLICPSSKRNAKKQDNAVSGKPNHVFLLSNKQVNTYVI